jgi:hypothetical protein
LKKNCKGDCIWEPLVDDHCSTDEGGVISSLDEVIEKYLTRDSSSGIGFSQDISSLIDIWVDINWDENKPRKYYII